MPALSRVTASKTVFCSLADTVIAAKQRHLHACVTYCYAQLAADTLVGVWVNLGEKSSQLLLVIHEATSSQL